MDSSLSSPDLDLGIFFLLNLSLTSWIILVAFQGLLLYCVFLELQCTYCELRWRIHHSLNKHRVMSAASFPFCVQDLIDFYNNYSCLFSGNMFHWLLGIFVSVL